MKKTIIIIIVLIILIAGGWYLYSQQDTEQEVKDSGTPNGEETTPTGEESSTGSDEDEKDSDEQQAQTDEDNPYYEADEVPAIAGPNEKIHQISERILTSVFDGVKLTDTDSDADPGDPKFDYTADYYYIVSEEISMDQAKQIREEILEEGGEINSTDVEAKYYRYNYVFEVDGVEYAAYMQIFVGGERELGDDPQTIELDVRLES